MDLQDGRWHDHALAGASLRLQDHEFRVRSTYGEVKGANLLDWPLTLQELEPWYGKAEDKMGVHPQPTAFRGCPATTTSR